MWKKCIHALCAHLSIKVFFWVILILVSIRLPTFRAQCSVSQQNLKRLFKPPPSPKEKEKSRKREKRMKKKKKRKLQIKKMFKQQSATITLGITLFHHHVTHYFTSTLLFLRANTQTNTHKNTHTHTHTHTHPMKMSALMAATASCPATS